MGINNDAILVYGIEFGYNEIKNLKQCEEIQNLITELDCDLMNILWEKLGVGFISTSDYYQCDEEYCCYIIGKQITTDMTLHEFLEKIDEDNIVSYLKNVCDKYNLTYTEPKILCRVNIT